MKPARKSFLLMYRSDMPFRGIVHRMRHQYNSESKQSITLVDMLKLHMPTHMCENCITSEKEGLHFPCELIEQNSELLDQKLSKEKHKVQLLLQAVLP